MSEFVSRGLARCLSGLLWAVARLPAPVNRVFVAAAEFAYVALAQDTRRTITTNLHHVEAGLAAHGVVVDNIDEFARRNLQATVKLLPETAVCWRGPPDAWRALIDEVHGEDATEVLAQAHAKQNNHSSSGASETGLSRKNVPEPAGDTRVLLLSPHLGNWELLNMYLGSEFGLTVLYDPPKLAALEPLIRGARERARGTVLPIGPAGLREMVQRLRKGWVVGLLPDQVPAKESGVLADFFGKQALTINLVHRLVSRHKPRVFLVCALRKSNGRFDIHFDELTAQLSGVSEVESAAALNSAVERRVAQAPEQYQWSYKRFKRVSPDAPNIYRQAALAKTPPHQAPGPDCSNMRQRRRTRK